MKKQLYRAAAATVLGLSLTTGIVAADAGNNISHTGPNSSNRVHTSVTNDTHIRNDNRIDADNYSQQTGYTGDAKVWGNTTGGNATSGNVSNDNSTKVELSVDNSAATSTNDPQGTMDPHNMGGDISHTGPNSSNHINTTVSNDVNINNDNHIDVSNVNKQTGTTGDATVAGNTTGGNATSGSVYNANSSTFKISVTN